FSAASIERIEHHLPAKVNDSSFESCLPDPTVTSVAYAKRPTKLPSRGVMQSEQAGSAIRRAERRKMAAARLAEAVRLREEVQQHLQKERMSMHEKEPQSSAAPRDCPSRNPPRIPSDTRDYYVSLALDMASLIGDLASSAVDISQGSAAFCQRPASQDTAPPRDQRLPLKHSVATSTHASWSSVLSGAASASVEASISCKPAEVQASSAARPNNYVGVDSKPRKSSLLTRQIRDLTLRLHAARATQIATLSSNRGSGQQKNISEEGGAPAQSRATGRWKAAMKRALSVRRERQVASRSPRSSVSSRLRASHRAPVHELDIPASIELRSSTKLLEASTELRSFTELLPLQSDGDELSSRAMIPPDGDDIDSNQSPESHRSCKDGLTLPGSRAPLPSTSSESEASELYTARRSRSFYPLSTRSSAGHVHRTEQTQQPSLDAELQLRKRRFRCRRSDSDEESLLAAVEGLSSTEEASKSEQSPSKASSDSQSHARARSRINQQLYEDSF
ncbi:MAG: hypothetical protein SGPRY_006013, partial [Prymnesium sp.]